MADNGLRWTAEDLERLEKRRRINRTGPGVAISSPLAQGAGQTGRTLTVTAEADVAPSPAPSKYRNRPVLVDFGPAGEIVNGHLRLIHTFQSAHEAAYFHECALRRKAKEIRDLRLQEPFSLRIYGVHGEPVHVGEWLADFVFWEGETRHVIDAKGVKTSLYLLKKKIVEACHGLIIEEV